MFCFTAECPLCCFLTQDWTCSYGFHAFPPRGETESPADHGTGTSHPQSAHLQGTALGPVDASYVHLWLKSIPSKNFIVFVLCVWECSSPEDKPRVLTCIHICVVSVCVCVCRAWVRKQVCHPVCCRLCGSAAVLMAFLQPWPPWGISTHPTSRYRCSPARVSLLDLKQTAHSGSLHNENRK